MKNEVTTKKDWVTFKPPMVLKKQSNKVLKLIDNAVKIHGKINNYQIIFHQSKVQKLKATFSYLCLEKVNYDKDTNIYDTITTEINKQIKSEQKIFENVIYPPVKDNLFLHKPLDYLNNSINSILKGYIVKIKNQLTILKKKIIQYGKMDFKQNNKQNFINN